MNAAGDRDASWLVDLEQLRIRNEGKVQLPRSASALVQAANNKRLFRRASRLDRFKHAWREAVGESLAASSEVMSYKEGELRVRVSSQALAHEIGVYRCTELVETVNEKLKGKDRISSLKVKAGRIRRK